MRRQAQGQKQPVTAAEAIAVLHAGRIEHQRRLGTHLRHTLRAADIATCEEQHQVHVVVRMLGHTGLGNRGAQQDQIEVSHLPPKQGLPAHLGDFATCARTGCGCRGGSASLHGARFQCGADAESSGHRPAHDRLAPPPCAPHRAQVCASFGNLCNPLGANPRTYRSASGSTATATACGHRHSGVKSNCSRPIGASIREGIRQSGCSVS